MTFFFKKSYTFWPVENVLSFLHKKPASTTHFSGVVTHMLETCDEWVPIFPSCEEYDPINHRWEEYDLGRMRYYTAITIKKHIYSHVTKRIAINIYRQAIANTWNCAKIVTTDHNKEDLEMRVSKPKGRRILTMIAIEYFLKLLFAKWALNLTFQINDSKVFRHEFAIVFTQLFWRK